ncbi:hypothetical protein FUAX_22950 [Fulvitalea axinellae]|uniref:Nudix hydrolase domain-containing protein n=2 Tax=Fulvitalea axinellae TaxID=1182444 RepID=A0AAU9D1R3_9BACT|nr:hypothetical protein FUAX_22950 [Fulvitalea axinellae]
MQYGESAVECLRREFIEETGLEIEVGTQCFTHEFLSPPLHAIELFFEVRITGGALRKGLDPELAEDKQIIQRVEFVPFEQLKEFPEGTVHQIFEKCNTTEDLLSLRGFFLNGEPVV